MASAEREDGRAAGGDDIALDRSRIDFGQHHMLVAGQRSGWRSEPGRGIEPGLFGSYRGQLHWRGSSRHRGSLR